MKVEKKSELIGRGGVLSSPCAPTRAALVPGILGGRGGGGEDGGGGREERTTAGTGSGSGPATVPTKKRVPALDGFFDKYLFFFMFVVFVSGIGDEQSKPGARPG